MLRIIKLCLLFENRLFVRYSSSRRYQFKVEKQIYYPIRVLSKNDESKTPLLVQKNIQKSITPSMNYYNILGVTKIASTQEIKTAYYNLAKKFHPDANPTPQETKSFQQISEAYHVLSDESNRLEYDQFGPVNSGKMFQYTTTLRDNNANIKNRCTFGGTGQYSDKTGNYIVSNVCDHFDGKRYFNKNDFKTCENRGIVVQRRRMEINTPPCSFSGDILKITNPLNKQRLNTRLHLDKTNYFKRDGLNISTDKYLTISQAVLGGKFKIRGLYEDFYVNLGPGVESHTTHRFKGKGVKTNTSLAGDHIVTIKVRIPKVLTTMQRQLIIALSKAEDPTFEG